MLHSSSRTQEIVSLSSAESEMYAAASGACDSVLIVGILKWMFDAFFQIHLYLDSAAARGIINRRGVGKVRHLFMATRTYGRWLTGRQSCLRHDQPSRYRHEETQCKPHESIDVFA